MTDEKLTLDQVLSELPFRGGVYRDPRRNKIYTLGDFNPHSCSGSPEFKGGQMVLPTDVSAIRAQVVLEEVLGLARPQYTLRNICRIIPTMVLKFSVPKGTTLTAQEKVPILEEPEISGAKFTPIDFDLWKNAVLIVMAREARYIPGGTDAMRIQVDDSARALAASENSQIKTIAEDVEDVTGADWGTDVNPYVNIEAAMDEIQPYPVDFIAASPFVWLDFFSNDKVKGTGQPIATPEGLMGGVFTVPGLPGVKGISEASLTATIALVGSTRAPALMFADGPNESARFANELAGYDAFIVRQWLEPKLVVADAIRKVTGVHA